jgi:dTMP kinase
MFVVFEGIDGSGKTTVSNMVAERLTGGGLKVKHLRAEGKFVSSVTEAIRDLGRDSRNLDLVPEAEFFLYVARDVQLIEEALRPALAAHDLIIADRFLYTAEILGSAGRKLEKAWMRPILDQAARGLEPDLVVLVDVDPVLARARRKAFKIAVRDKRPPSRKGLAGVGLQHRMRRGYLELAQASPERWVVVDNEDELEATVERVTNLIRRAASEGAAEAIRAFRAEQSRRPTPAPLGSWQDAFQAFLRWVDQRSEREPRVAAYLLSGLFGGEIDARRRALSERVPEAILAGLAGLDDVVSWELREALADKHPGPVARTLAGFPFSHARARALRQRLEALAPNDVIFSCEGDDAAEAWAIRDRHYDAARSQVISSLANIASDRAWDLRERWLREVGDKLGRDYEDARTACKSITGLDDDRAWAIRASARQVAPVAALSSVAGLIGPRSLGLREENLSRATKVVMATLRRATDPRAWRMRQQVASDCKEAVDSIDSLDTSEAWELRERCADIWPSTVVKTLGPLADVERGRALVNRQLQRYPGNVSLLKHVSAMFLGLHRMKFQSEELAP